MNTQAKALTKPQSKRELREWLQSEEVRRELVALLPRTMSAERFVRIAFQAIHRNPELLKTSQESFFNCLLQLGAMGLEPDGRRAHLIPFGTECTLVVDYKGIKELVRRNHDVSVMHGDVVGENDEFEVRYGTRGILDHVPNLKNRGKIVCAYSWVKLPDGNEEYDVMSFEEIETIRKRSRSPNKGPWVTDWNEMAKKTVFRRHAKALPLSPETRDALERDQDGDALSEQERFKAAAPARATVLGSNAKRSGRIESGDQTDAWQGRSQTESVPVIEEDFLPPSADKAHSGPSLAAQVAKRLEEHGYSQAELLALMKSLKLAAKQASTLEDIADQHLKMVLDDWEDCVGRLREQREQANQAAKP